jgi:MOSC domain-containing protein YiiM
MTPPAGHIVGIHLCRAHREPMESVERVRALPGQGLEGDRHAHAEGKRQVLLAEAEELHAMGLQPGVIKENITVEGLHLSELPFGQRLRLGRWVIAELQWPCEPCFRMDEIRLGLKEQLVGRRGYFIRIVEGGELAVGDQLSVLTEEVAVSPRVSPDSEATIGGR